MAKADTKGIMALPGKPSPEDTAAPAMPQMGLNESYDAVQQGLTNASPAASDQLNAALSQITPQLDQLSDDQLNLLLQVIQYLHDHPEEYEKRIAELVQQGVIEELSLIHI